MTQDLSDDWRPRDFTGEYRPPTGVRGEREPGALRRPLGRNPFHPDDGDLAGAILITRDLRSSFA